MSVQFGKYCVVGLLNFAIQYGTYLCFLQYASPGWIPDLLLPGEVSRRDLHMIAANCLGFGLAISNAFVWHRLWTFRGQPWQRPGLQYLQFSLVCLGGMLISNVLLLASVRLLQQWEYPELAARRVAQPLTLPAVTLWNFAMNRYWTFAPSHVETEGKRAVSRR